MFINSTKAFLFATRLLFKRWRTILLLGAIYGTLLASIYVFVITKESSITQLAVSVGLMIIVPLLFFVVQAAGINYTSTASTVSLVKKAASDCWKLMLVSLPLIALIILALYALGKAQAHFTVTPLSVSASGEMQQPTTHKALTLLTTVRYALTGVVAPLLLIHFWIATGRGGLSYLFTNLRRVIGYAFATESILIYGFGSLLFLLVPYLTLTRPLTIQRPWLEISFLALRLLFAAVLILIGWVGTVGALSIITRSADSQLAPESE